MLWSSESVYLEPPRRPHYLAILDASDLLDLEIQGLKDQTLRSDPDLADPDLKPTLFNRASATTFGIRFPGIHFPWSLPPIPRVMLESAWVYDAVMVMSL